MSCLHSGHLHHHDGNHDLRFVPDRYLLVRRRRFCNGPLVIVTMRYLPWGQLCCRDGHSDLRAVPNWYLSDRRWHFCRLPQLGKSVFSL